jgi:hypothetical protein
MPCVATRAPAVPPPPYPRACRSLTTDRPRPCRSASGGVAL